jgi:hypothetical protein
MANLGGSHCCAGSSVCSAVILRWRFLFAVPVVACPSIPCLSLLRSLFPPHNLSFSVATGRDRESGHSQFESGKHRAFCKSPRSSQVLAGEDRANTALESGGGQALSATRLESLRGIIAAMAMHRVSSPEKYTAFHLASKI